MSPLPLPYLQPRTLLSPLSSTPFSTHLRQTLTKRAVTSCPYYSTSCGVHRTVIIIIIIAVVIIMLSLLLLIFHRHQRHRNLLRAKAVANANNNNNSNAGYAYGGGATYTVGGGGSQSMEQVVRVGTAPPPYEMPKKPERVAGLEGRGVV